MFNQGDYTARLASGQLQSVPVAQRHLQQETADAKGMPYCTTSQIIRYVDDQNVWQAEIHQYLMLDGQLGASGKPDPKRIRQGGKIWAVDRTKATP
jgi:hypothetical protein